MRKQNFTPFFLVFFGLSVILILVGSSGILTDISSIFNRGLAPSRSLANVMTLKSLQNQTIKSLSSENLQLRHEMKDIKNILDENVALKSQFEVSEEISQNLLPAKVIGAPGFVPGVSLPEYLIIDKGEKAGLKKGDTIISDNFLVGKISEIYPDFSKVELITNKKSSFTATVLGQDDSNGIIKGQGQEEIVLDNVLLTTSLKKGAEVVTKGDKNEKGEGYGPDINIGKIYSIEKKQSDLFQKASIKSPIDFKNLEMVFVIR